MDRTTTQDIQEMLEGLLNDEQTAEVLHRLSVSPEKLTAFRQHMALQGAFDRDGRANEMTEDEDRAVWAAVLGATGGVVTGGAATGASGWLGRAAAFIATGIAGFFIGTAADVDLSQTPPPVAQQPIPAAAAPLAATAPGITRIDTVIQTVVKPQIVYRDRIVYRKEAEAPALADAATRQELSQELLGHASTSNPTTVPPGNTASGPSGLPSNDKQATDSRNTQAMPPADQNGAAMSHNTPSAASEETARNAVDLTPYPDPNKELHSTAPKQAPESIAEKSDAARPEQSKNTSRTSLMRNGWEIGYNERLGRIAPAPAGLNDVDPNFGGRAIDLSYRLLDGSLGVGGRLIYGSFSRITLQEEKWFALGEEETKFHPALGTEKGFGTEIFFNYRFPLFTDRLALGTEFTLGAISTHSKIGADISLLYLITNRLGAQIGAGYSRYFYNTTQIRQEALDRFMNTGTTADLNEVYQGSMLEGRYGLFFRF